ncbi:MAG: RNA methyltransferase [Bacteroidales bacterium]|nr:RNA methyltransferase [Bacteroidales bacterium]
MRKKNIVELTRCTVEEYTSMKKLPLMLLADNVRSMHNVGSLLRTSDAFLVEEVVLAGITGCPPHPEISKSALGAEESVAWRYVRDAYAEVVRLKQEGWRICVLEQVHGSILLEDFRATSGEKYLLVAGNEVSGVDQRIVDIADVVLEIPQWGTKHSLNVSVSGGIALYVLAMEIGKHQR